MKHIVLSVALVLAACGKSLDDLSPFPCADDGSCPSGFQCCDGECNAGPNVDGVCDGETIPCACGQSCVAPGVCEAGCSGDSDCSSGRLCAGGSCFEECGAASSCPSGLSCNRRYSDDKSVCGPMFFACTSVTSSQLCTSTLCGMNADFTVPCGAHSCGHHEECTNADTACLCPTGLDLLTCSNQPVTAPTTQCAVGPSGDPACWCVPTNVQTPSCLSDHFEISGTCECANGQPVAFGCGDTKTCEQLCGG